MQNFRLINKKGLNCHQMNDFLDFVIVANEQQLKAMKRVIEMAPEKRMNIEEEFGDGK